MFGRYSFSEILICTGVAIFLLTTTVLCFINSSHHTDKVFSAGFDSIEELFTYRYKSFTTAVLLFICFYIVYHFLNLFYIQVFNGFYDGTIQSLFYLSLWCQYDINIIICLMLFTLLTLLLVTLLLKATHLYVILPTSCREGFNLWFSFIILVALIFTLAYIIIILSILLDPTQLTNYLGCLNFLDFVEAILTAALEQLVSHEFIIVYAFSYVCAVLIFFFWRLF
jgi:hypothetical protein